LSKEVAEWGFETRVCDIAPTSEPTYAADGGTNCSDNQGRFKCDENANARASTQDNPDDHAPPSALGRGLRAPIRHRVAVNRRARVLLLRRYKKDKKILFDKAGGLELL
jgi:hypothetical protein